MTAFIAPQHIMNDFAPAAGGLPLNVPPPTLEHAVPLYYYVHEPTMKATKPVKRVRFADDIIIPAPSPLVQLTDEEFPQMWFSVEDMEQFRNEARELCRQMRTTEQATANSYAKVCSMAHCPKTRGLESRACLERQRRKILANKCIVRAQSQLEGDRLAALARRCTRWAAEIAQEEAARDYARAHSVDEVADGLKRTLCEESEGLYTDRRVRQRVSS
mmetsp:Transcript_11584/g.25896  ORF Transcript_11584/g.25896 Transcript_11584/m.25896 type:complete len:217 (+) Transcript_11584:202-852(+)